MNDFVKALLNNGQVGISDLLLKYFSELGLTHSEFLTYIELVSFKDQGDLFPEPKKLSKRLNISDSEVFQLIHNLTQKGIIRLTSQKNKEGKMIDSYDLTAVFEKLEIVVEQHENQTAQIIQEKKQSSIFQQIEMEFGRPLTPIEMEMIDDWLVKDHYSSEMIYQALRESVLNQAYSLKYMDRILLNWEHKKIQTPAQLERYRSNQNRI